MPVKEQKKEKLDNKEIETTLSESSQKILNDFLSPYADNSKITVKNAILTYYYYDIEKNDFRNWDYDDYLKVLPTDTTKKLNTKQSYIRNFFLYLLIFDYLNSEKHFDSIWVKEVELQRYISSSRKGKKKMDESPNTDNSLTIEEVFAIQNVLETKTEDLQVLKMQFSWYAIFEMGLEISFLRKKLDPNIHYKNETIVVGEEIYLLPDKFKFLFDRLIGKDYYNGFSSTDIFFEQLGKYAGLERKLIPRDIKITREKLMIECGNCKCKYVNLAEKWVAINGRIVCKDCGEMLKKKFDFHLEEIEQINVDTSDSSRTLIFQQFEKLQEKLKNTTINYLKLHEFQIEVGKLGEIFAYNYEREKLEGTKYLEKLDRTKSLNALNGYDILSYDLKGKELCIEVKCTVNSDPVFYISTHEVDTFKKIHESGGKYYVYLITDIMSDRPNMTIIENLLDDKRLIFTENGWKVEVQDS